MPIFLRIFFLWVSIVRGDTFISSAIFLLGLPYLIRLAIRISVGVRLKYFKDICRVNGDMISFRFDSIILKKASCRSSNSVFLIFSKYGTISFFTFVITLSSISFLSSCLFFNKTFIAVLISSRLFVFSSNSPVRSPTLYSSSFLAL